MAPRRANVVFELAFRLVRRLLVLPLSSWYRGQDAYLQLGRVEHCGEGISVRAPISIGDPPTTHIGDGVAINPGFTSKGRGGVRIGAYSHFGANVSILTEDHQYRDAEAIPYGRERISRPVEIGVACWFGDGVVITPGTRIGDGCVVGTGSVVSGEIPAYSVVAGAPAVDIKQRDAEHFDRRRAAGDYLDVDLRDVLIDQRPFPHPRRSSTRR